MSVPHGETRIWDVGHWLDPPARSAIAHDCGLHREPVRACVPTLASAGLSWSPVVLALRSRFNGAKEGQPRSAACHDRVWNPISVSAVPDPGS